MPAAPAHPARPARDGWRTRARISDVATALFLARGFEPVTVAEVAKAAGVSKVTVFAHFARKEDLMLDRAPEASELIRGALRDRPATVSPVQALRQLAGRLLAERHPLSGIVRADSVPFIRTVAGSPALISRAREMTADLEAELGQLLADDPDGGPEPRVLAALIIGAYRTLLAASARRVLDGEAPEDVVPDHQRRLDRAFDALEAAARSLRS